MTFTNLYNTIDNQLEDDQRIMDMTDADYDLITADLSDPNVIDAYMANDLQVVHETESYILVKETVVTEGGWAKTTYSHIDLEDVEEGSDCCGASDWMDMGICSDCKEHSEFN
tara:strand:- start:350 stop:688 length:339 start_codon:yes stop_codon:yes gene_type:complete